MANSNMINSEWEPSELEHINKCPYCASNNRSIAYQNVQDWSFYTAPGKWTYWDCLDCKTLYLDPRPKAQYIHKAYANYYTHENAGSNFISNFKLRLKNEIIAKKYAIKLYPNLFLPMFFKHILKFFNGIIYEPYGISHLLSSPKGKFMDVGCGGGLVLAIAKQYGWDVTGLEIDAEAVKAANKKNLNVFEGGYEKLDNYVDCFDLIYCAHVLEHVYDPKEMLIKIKKSLKPNGRLLLALPNSQSFLRKIFGASWRGIEAPRHIAIPSHVELMKYLNEIGFDTFSQKDNRTFTKNSSLSVAKNNSIAFRKLNFNPDFIDNYNQDFSFIFCVARN
jgi:2-polyprenyl-3-methyl-5-hydroxy-6-metoxy-1,4-benzoquinol methylase